MKNCMIWSVVLLAMAGIARGETKVPPKELAVDLGGGVKLEMVLIPAGEFLMGSPDADNAVTGYARPQHRVRITVPFYLGKYQVTQEQWRAVMRRNPSYVHASKHPVEQVSWQDCQQFLDKLNLRQGNPAGKFLLPTEAQWEYACRAGSTTNYCCGGDETRLEEYGWYDVNSGRRTHPVGQKKANAFGLYDMHGNVWEWCADWYDEGYYAKSPADDPRGPATGLARVRRGGSAYGPAKNCRSSNRNYLVPRESDLDLGFRVSCVPAE